MKKISPSIIILFIIISTFNPGSKVSAKKKKRANDLLVIPKLEKKDKICFALYTVHNSILKMTVQLYELEKEDSKKVYLEIRKNKKWVRAAETDIVSKWVALFRVEKWDMTKDHEYRVLALDGKAEYRGIIKKDPIDKDVIIIAAFTGNSIRAAHGGDIPRSDIVSNIKKIKPDLLFFSGDQVYNHNQHFKYWLKFGMDFGEVIRNIPTVTIPDDHDVGQANLWGAEGRRSHTGAGNDGGYFKPVSYVKEVERAQTSHLPDPYDPTPIQRGIGVYYTALNVGRVSFAIIEDRKFKSGPKGLVPKMGPRPDHIRDPNYDPKSIDVAGAKLLGGRQLKFLEEWAGDWKGADMKCVLSQTIFCGGAHIHGKYNGRLHADMDSNGWPQTGRNKALARMRKAFALHVAGDQHLGTIFHHGIDEWEDAVFSFCVPSIANLYLRWWKPIKPGENREPGAPEYTGRHFDGFNNRVTCYAAANPLKKTKWAKKLTTRAAGFGVVRFNKKNRTITMECWPRNVDISGSGAKQYPGWPKRIKQEDNYGRKPSAYLPELQVKGMIDPVVQIIDEKNNEIVYTIRINGKSYRPKVFNKGSYTIKVGEPGTKKEKVLKGIKALDPKKKKILKIEFPGRR